MTVSSPRISPASGWTGGTNYGNHGPQCNSAGGTSSLCYHACMAKQMTVRNVPDGVARRLERLSREQKKSVNAFVVGILENAVGIKARRARLERYATWTKADLDEFNEVLRDQRQVDAKLWK